jgi:Xaa-Pro aminopeptidase
MTDDQREKVTLAISDEELERRWSAVRARMRDERIDLLVMQDQNEWLGGYVKWFTDVPARSGYPVTVAFPVDDPMTLIVSGGKPPGDKGPPAWTLRGVKNALSAPYFPSLRYSNTYDAEMLVETFKGRRGYTIGFLGKGRIPAAFYEYLVNRAEGATFVDATDLVDEIKAVKSREEIGLIKKTAALQDEVIAYAKTVIKPGRKDFEIVADLIHKAILLGSEEQLIMGGSGPAGKPVPFQNRHFQGRTLRENEQFSVLIEVNGPGGMYAELGRIFFTGKVPGELYDGYELCKEAQRKSLEMLKPGADPADVWQANNEFLVSRGQFPETRLYAHGQGYDLVERPAIRDDEPMRLRANMHLAVHPGFNSDSLWVSICDNYLITDTGVSPCLHRTAQEIFSV